MAAGPGRGTGLEVPRMQAISGLPGHPACAKVSSCAAFFRWIQVCACGRQLRASHGCYGLA